MQIGVIGARIFLKRWSYPVAWTEIITFRRWTCLFGKSWGDSLCPIQGRLCKKSRIPPAYRPTARPTQRWAQPPLGQMVLFSLRWEVSALTGAIEWVARPPELALFLTIQATTLGSAPKNPEMTSTIFKIFELHADWNCHRQHRPSTRRGCLS